MSACSAESEQLGQEKSEAKVDSTRSQLTSAPSPSVPGPFAETDVTALLKTAGLDGKAPPLAKARATEVREHLLKDHFSKYHVLSTTHTAAGETVDWVDPHGLDPDFDSRTPPLPQKAPDGVDNAQSVTPASLRGLGSPSLQGPLGLAPVLRPNFSYYISGESGKPNLAAFIASIEKPRSASTTHLYAGYRDASATPLNTATQAWVNLWDIQGVPADGMSLVQGAMSSCQSTAQGAALESVEWGVMKQRALYGDDLLHHFAYFNTNGYTSEGDYKGGYNQIHLGFVPCAAPVCPVAFTPGAIVGGPYSTGGGTQYERRLEIQLFQNAWWIGDFTTTVTWLGYYPIGPIDQQKIPYQFLTTGACNASWFGETFDPTPTTWNTEDMAGGFFPSQGYGWAGYVRNIINARASGNVWFSTSASTLPEEPLCYTRSSIGSGSGNWSRYFYYGGPGRTSRAPGTCL